VNIASVIRRYSRWQEREVQFPRQPKRTSEFKEGARNLGGIEADEVGKE